MNRIFMIAMSVTLAFLMMALWMPQGDLEMEVDVSALATGIILNETITEGRIETTVYKTIDDEQLEMDIYFPLVELYEETPVVIFFHGGSWVAGSKATIANGDRKVLVSRLRQEGYAVIAVEYRTLTSTLNLPENILDCQDAIRFVRKVSSGYGFDSENIGLWGTSAGGHLALLAATTDPTVEVAYVVTYYTPVTLPALMETQSLLDDEVVESLFGATDVKESIEALLIQADYFSPITHVEAIDFPLLMVHGTADMIVPVEHTKMMAEAMVLSSKEHFCNTLFIEDAGHGFLKEGKSTEEDRDEIIEATVTFILEQQDLKPSK